MGLCPDPRTRTQLPRVMDTLSMTTLALVSAARIATLATGRGGMPTADEWPFVALLLVLAGAIGVKLLMTTGLSRVEAALVAVAAPLLVVFDAPLGNLSPDMGLAVNVAGCLLPVGIGLWVFLTRRLPILEVFVLLGTAVLVAFFSSHVVPSKGVLLSYRVPALVVGVVAAALFHKRPERAGAAAFAAGGMGVLLGADVMHLRELADLGGAGRVILGGAGLLDGIFLVAVLAGAIGASISLVAQFALGTRSPIRRGAA